MLLTHPWIAAALVAATSAHAAPLSFTGRAEPGSHDAMSVIRNVQVVCPTALDSTAPRFSRVRIEHGAIVSIEPELAQTGETEVESGEFDGAGRYLVPGFYDMHVHLPGVGSAIPEAFQRRALEMQLAAGITTARVARGSYALLALKKAQARGEIRGPRLFLAAPPLTRNRFPKIEDAPAQFRLWKAQGFDAVKFLSGPSAAEHGEHARAAVEAGLRWYGHLPMGAVSTWPLDALTSLEHASAIERLADLFPETFDADLERLADAGIFVCPDIDFYYAGAGLPSWEALGSRPGLGELPHGIIAEWTEGSRSPDPRRETKKRTIERFREVVPRLRAAGVELLVSPSDPIFCAPGHGFAIEAAHLVDAGYTPAEVFRMATLNGALCQGEADHRGAVQVGYIADLVLLGSDPTESAEAFAAVQAVWQGGRLQE